MSHFEQTLLGVIFVGPFKNSYIEIFKSHFLVTLICVCNIFLNNNYIVANNCV